jgi:hypothetical protein
MRMRQVLAVALCSFLLTTGCKSRIANAPVVIDISKPTEIKITPGTTIYFKTSDSALADTDVVFTPSLCEQTVQVKLGQQSACTIPDTATAGTYTYELSGGISALKPTPCKYCAIVVSPKPKPKN